MTLILCHLELMVYFSSVLLCRCICKQGHLSISSVVFPGIDYWDKSLIPFDLKPHLRPYHFWWISISEEGKCQICSLGLVFQRRGKYPNLSSVSSSHLGRTTIFSLNYHIHSSDVLVSSNQAEYLFFFFSSLQGKSLPFCVLNVSPLRFIFAPLS